MIRVFALSILVGVVCFALYWLGIEQGRRIEQIDTLNQAMSKETTCVVEFHTSTRQKRETHRIYGRAKEVL